MQIRYTDTLVTITDTTLILKHYYFPSGREKHIPFTDIASMRILSPTVLNGKWRLHGTGNIRTWFPKDFNRPHRTAIFHLDLYSQWVNIRFTVEDTETVRRLFQDQNLLQSA